MDSTPELDDILQAYYKTAYSFDWPQLLIKRGIRILADNKKYSLPSNVRKLHYVYVEGVKYEETELDYVHKMSRKFAIDRSTDEIVISSTPSSSATQYTMTNAESAGNAVTIELNSVSGLSAGDEIYIDDGTNPEVTYIQSIDSSGNTITARLDTSKSASTILYRGKDIIMIAYYRTVVDLSASGDEPLLPSVVHYPMLHYAAYLAYARLEQFDEADRNLKIWQEQMQDYWRAFDSNSTGAVTTFG
ncbi:MAG: hypothetical protein AAB875_06130, partial [Patescibacteria group bacterium]